MWSCESSNMTASLMDEHTLVQLGIVCCPQNSDCFEPWRPVATIHEVAHLKKLNLNSRRTVPWPELSLRSQLDPKTAGVLSTTMNINDKRSLFPGDAGRGGIQGLPGLPGPKGGILNHQSLSA